MHKVQEGGRVMAMTGFICHDDYYDRLQRLTDEEVGHLFRQLMLYHAGRKNEMTDFIGMEGLAFDFISNDIDRMEEKRTDASETNRLNGLKGGRPKNPTKPNETEENRTKATETEENPTKPYKDKEKDKEKDTEKENAKKKKLECAELFTEFWAAYPRKTSKAEAQKAFEKLNPDREMLETMIAAIQRQKNTSQWQEERFIPHPSTWLNQRRWEDEVKDEPAVKPVVKVLPAQQYQQRDYSTMQDEIRARMMAMMEAAGDV